MTTKQTERHAEVMFWAYFQKLVKHYQNATTATKYLNALVTLFNCDKPIMDQIILECLLQNKKCPSIAEQYAYAKISGYTAQEIADSFGVSARTVYRHWENMPDIAFSFTPTQRKELVKFINALREHRGLILC